MIDARDLLEAEEKGKDEREVEIILKMHNKGIPAEQISDMTDIAIERVLEIINKHT
jgi:hypothetical protein